MNDDSSIFVVRDLKFKPPAHDDWSASTMTYTFTSDIDRWQIESKFEPIISKSNETWIVKFKEKL